MSTLRLAAEVVDPDGNEVISHFISFIEKASVARNPQGPILRFNQAGAFRVGVEHGFYCIGCCWALMLLLFAGGVMNVVVIAGLAVWVAFEEFGHSALRRLVPR